jgi:hypothetical protein
MEEHQDTSGRIVVAADVLEGFCAEVFVSLGMPPAAAQLAARSLVKPIFAGSNRTASSA